MKYFLFPFFKLSLIFMLGLALVEFALISLKNIPFLARIDIISDTARELYTTHRNNVHFMPECTQYDEELGYILRPGECVFPNAEFEVTFRINSIGVRDDEASLQEPKVIIAGDSMAMGWGIDQDSTYASLVEEKTGYTVLNTGISSYGTVRELRLLEKVDTDSLQFFFIQYCNNDMGENRDPAGTIKWLKENYDSLVESQAELTEYTLGKYLLFYWKKTIGQYTLEEVIDLLKGYIKYPEEKKKDMANSKRKTAGELATKQTEKYIKHADLFLYALKGAKTDLSKVQIIVFELNSYGRNTSGFINALEQRKNDSTYPEFIRDLKTIDFSKVLGPEHYFTLDDHINKAGHRKVAENMLKMLK